MYVSQKVWCSKFMEKHILEFVAVEVELKICLDRLLNRER